MTFERRRSPDLAFHCYAPNAPNDITPAQVRNYLAEHPVVKVVRLSGGWMNRPKTVQGEWRNLDDELYEVEVLRCQVNFKLWRLRAAFDDTHIYPKEFREF